MSTSKRDLAAIRADIDAIDREIQSLLNRRAGCAQEVADAKKAELLAGGESGAVTYYRPEREAQVLRAVMERNSGPLPATEVAHIFREIMSACLALEQPLKIAFLGPEGTFTQAAAIKHFGHAVISHPLPTIAGVFEEVEDGEANYGVVPVENSTEGMVSHTLDSFMGSTVRVCGEVELPIRLHLLARKGTDPSSIKVIQAHQQALAQSRHWLERNYPNAELRGASSNAEAARRASQEDGVAAVAGDMAMELYQLEAVAKNIQDLAANTTRFLVVGREAVPPSGADKTSIVVSTHNKPGALFKLLEPFQRAGLSLTRIDTRPSRSEAWTYFFFMEFEGHEDEDRVAAVLAELEEQSIMLKRLGSYPQAVI